MQEVGFEREPGGMSYDIRQEVINSQNVTVIGVQNLHIVPIPRAWKRPDEADPVRRWERAVGRRAELDALKDRLAGESRAAITAAVTGMAGVGKSTLASMFVQENGSAYPGGVLWADLGMTFDAARRGEILERWACYAYGGDPQFVTQVLRQQNFQLQPDAVRALLSAQGAMLVVLDDIWDYAATEPLIRALPPDARLIVTTHDAQIGQKFKGLQKLDMLILPDALALLRDRLPDAPGDLLERLADTLDCHPQALSIAADDLALREPYEWPGKIDDLVRLVEQGESFGDLPLMGETRQSEVEAALFVSYKALGDNPNLGAMGQRRFRLLGAFAAPEADFGLEAVTWMWEEGTPPSSVAEGKEWGASQAQEFLTALKARSLIEPGNTPGRWRQHALLRAYALALLKDAGEEAAARTRHLEFYQVWADTWIGEKYNPSALEPDLDQYRHAFEWARDHVPERLVTFVMAGWQFLYMMNHYADLRPWLNAALRVAGEQGDVLGQANTLQALGNLDLLTGDLAAARTYLDRALPLFEQMGGLLGQANTLKALGDVSLAMGASAAARAFFDRALPLYEQAGRLLGQANTLWSLGDVSLATGDLAAARAFFDRALPLYEQVSDLLGQANTLKSLGYLSRVIGDPAAARALYDRALPLYEQVSDLLGQANTLQALGDVSFQIGDPAAARTLYDRALPLFEQVGEPMGQANTLRSIGNLFQGAEKWTQALDLFERAIELYRAAGSDYGRGTALTDMLPTLVALGRVEEALSNALEALQIDSSQGRQGVVRIDMRTIRNLRTQVGTAAFDAAWQAVDGGPQPDWLQDPEA